MGDIEYARSSEESYHSVPSFFVTKSFCANLPLSDGDEGTPWADLYARDMGMCRGFDTTLKRTLPCLPATVIYGHAASRGLDVNRWSFGLDSGCVYRRRLSALVLGGRYAKTALADDDLDFSAEDADISDDDAAYNIDGKRVRSVVRFGDHGKGKIVSVRCH